MNLYVSISSANSSKIALFVSASKTHKKSDPFDSSKIVMLSSQPYYMRNKISLLLELQKEDNHKQTCCLFLPKLYKYRLHTKLNKCKFDQIPLELLCRGYHHIQAKCIYGLRLSWFDPCEICSIISRLCELLLTFHLRLLYNCTTLMTLINENCPV